MKVTRNGIIIFLTILLVFSTACAIGGTAPAPAATPIIITATSEGPADPGVFLTQTAAVMPTSVPEPHTLPPTLRLVYTDTSGNLFSWTQANGVRPLLASGDILGARLSDDGLWVAFTRSTDYLHFSLWVIGFDGAGERQLLTPDQLFALKNSADAVGVEPYIFSWVPNSHTIAFNTSPKFEGPGLMINDDLHLVNAETGAFSTLLTPGNGGVFYYSPDGTQIALVTPQNISLINADGSNRRSNVLVYDPVMTYSEFQYYAAPQWAADGSFLRVAIPPQASLDNPGDMTTLWHIPTDGSPAGVAGHVLTAPLSAVTLSPDLGWIAYQSYFSDNTDNRRNLHINTVTGTSDHIYTTGDVNIDTWATDSVHFVYTDHAGNQSKYANKDDGEVLLLPTGSVMNIHFANAFTYIYLKDGGAQWEIYYGNMDGTQTLIASMPKPGGGKYPGYSFVN
jgi:hypothetical protein